MYEKNTFSISFSSFFSFQHVETIQHQTVSSTSSSSISKQQQQQQTKTPNNDYFTSAKNTRNSMKANSLKKITVVKLNRSYRTVPSFSSSTHSYHTVPDLIQEYNGSLSDDKKQNNSQVETIENLHLIENSCDEKARELCVLDVLEEDEFTVSSNRKFDEVIIDNDDQISLCASDRDESELININNESTSRIFENNVNETGITSVAADQFALHVPPRTTQSPVLGDVQDNSVTSCVQSDEPWLLNMTSPTKGTEDILTDYDVSEKLRTGTEESYINASTDEDTVTLKSPTNESLNDIKNLDSNQQSTSQLDNVTVSTEFREVIPECQAGPSGYVKHTDYTTASQTCSSRDDYYLSDSDVSITEIRMDKEEPTVIILLSDSDDEIDLNSKDHNRGKHKAKAKAKAVGIQESLRNQTGCGYREDLKDITCSICLGPFENRSFLNQCFHILF